MHFDIIVTFREKDAHAMLKRNLIIFIDDFKIIMNNLNLLLINQRYDYLIEFENVKIRYSLQCRIDFFQNIFAFVTLYVLRKILKQYKRMTDESTIFSACIKTFSTTLRLSCAHIIQERLESTDCLLIDDVHSH
jgi:glycerol-3-phosphate dehydrogenase